MRAAVGVSVATRVAALYATVAGTGVVPGPVSSIVVALIEAAAIASLKVAVIGPPPVVVPVGGVTAVTVGGVVSMVKVHAMSVASGLPARSVTPLFTVAV